MRHSGSRTYSPLARPAGDAGVRVGTADNVDKRVLTLQKFRTDAVLLPLLPPLSGQGLAL